LDFDVITFFKNYGLCLDFDWLLKIEDWIWITKIWQSAHLYYVPEVSREPEYQKGLR